VVWQELKTVIKKRKEQINSSLVFMSPVLLTVWLPGFT